MDGRVILLTGASGVIGSAVRPALRERHREVRLLDLRPPPDPQANETPVLADITDRAALEAAMAGVDCAVHLAGIPDEAPWPELRKANIDGTLSVFEAARRQRVRRVVFASSHHVVGLTPLGTRVAVDAAPLPSGLYGVSKVFGEAVGRLYAAKHGIEVVALRIAAFQPAPHDHRQLLLWISPRDTAQLILRSIAAATPGFLAVFGVSGNARNPYDTAGWEQLGYRPEDDSEHFLGTSPDLMGQPTRPTDRTCGGEASLRDPLGL